VEEFSGSEKADGNAINGSEVTELRRFIVPSTSTATRYRWQASSVYPRKLLNLVPKRVHCSLARFDAIYSSFRMSDIHLSRAVLPPTSSASAFKALFCH